MSLAEIRARIDADIGRENSAALCMELRRDRVVVEARQIESYLYLQGVTEWVEALGGRASYGQTDNGPAHMFVLTPEGVVRADVGDWVIRNAAGEFYPCRPKRFAETYELTAPPCGGDAYRPWGRGVATADETGGEMSLADIRTRAREDIGRENSAALWGDAYSAAEQMRERLEATDADT